MIVSTVLALSLIIPPPHTMAEAIVDAAYVSGRCIAWIPDHSAVETSVDEGGPELRAVYDNGVHDAKTGMRGEICYRLMLEVNDNLRRLAPANQQPSALDNGN